MFTFDLFLIFWDKDPFIRRFLKAKFWSCYLVARICPFCCMPGDIFLLILCMCVCVCVFMYVCLSNNVLASFQVWSTLSNLFVYSCVCVCVFSRHSWVFFITVYIGFVGFECYHNESVKKMRIWKISYNRMDKS